MNRKAFLLGLLSIGGQTLLLKELVSSLNGDELFIGTALFGWLISIAIGAYIGGRKTINFNSGPMFFIGVVLLPLLILVTRFSPMIIISTAGEIVPFATASLISIMVMIPLGLVSGGLFPVITHEGHRPAASIVRAYLFEGIGAFIGGVVVVALAGSIFSTLGAALAISTVVIGMYYLPAKTRDISILSGGLLLILLMVWFAGPLLDRYFDQIKYSAFKVEKTFDTHYGHQTILSRDESFTLLTDNKIEATYPNLYHTENLLLPPLAYKSDSKNILYVGRTEFGIAQLVEKMPTVKLTALDPREMLSREIDKLLPTSSLVPRIHDDQLSYFIEKRLLTKYDIIIINPGELDNYKNSRLLSDKFLSYTKMLLKPDGILYYPSYYDSDRYLGSEKEEILSIINNTLKRYFVDVYLWPGEMTLFFASDKSFEAISPDSIPGLIERTGYHPRFLTETFIADRLNDIKYERLNSAIISSNKTNSTDKPVLVYKQAKLKSMTSKTDQRIIALLFEENTWVLSVPLMIIIFFLITILRNHRRRNYGLFLYFIAGIVSISLELISFYLYQSAAGSLYSELAILIGVFMLGLALGTYYSCRVNRENLEFPAILLLLTSAVLFFATYDKVGLNSMLYYHLLFLFTMALATGSLFVAATDRFYFGKTEANRGIGYTFEILGSAIGALIVTTILLPLIGIYWLMISIIILITLTLIGAVMTVR